MRLAWKILVLGKLMEMENAASLKEEGLFSW
jgi:hypothetical protein